MRPFDRELDQAIIDCMVADDRTRLGELARGELNEDSIRDHAHALGLTQDFIKQCRLSGSRPAMRGCIACDDRFLSTGISNRLCRRCARR